MIIDTPVSDLKVGDLCDLSGDPLADPDRTPALEFEYAEIIAIAVETSDCIAVEFADYDVVGFPPEYVVRVYKEKVPA
jgi:hypothetical protein